jgi:hypothetical protein
MIRKLTVIALLLHALACEPEKEIQPVGETQPKSDLHNQGNKPYKPTHRVFKRSLPESGHVITPSGPAFKANGQKQSAISAKTESIPFQVNAGAIWVNPADGATHLWAMQLPSSDGPIQEESLGAGWEGTTHLTMDHQYFYAVHEDNIYRVDKQKFNSWELVVPSNGQRIDAIEGDQDFRSGCFFVRGNTVYYYNAIESFITPLLKNPSINLNWAEMAVIRNGAGGVFLYFVTGKFDELWRLSINSTFSEQKWLKMTNYGTQLFNHNIIGDPAQYRLYESGVQLGSSDVFRTNIINPNAGNQFPLGFFYDILDNPWPQPDGPQYPLFLSGDLAINNSWLWMSAIYHDGPFISSRTNSVSVKSGHSLFKMRTLGSGAGQIEDEYTGWEGTKLFCAYPQLHFN